MFRLFRSIFFTIIILCEPSFCSEEAIISGEDLSKLGSPIQVNVVWSRLDGKFEILNDFYLKTDLNPITKTELAEKCLMRNLLPYLVNAEPICPLKLTVTVKLASAGEGGEQETITDFAVMNKDSLEYYGFIERRK